MKMNLNKISIVIPVYNEEGNILPLFEEVVLSLESDFKQFDYEIIIVNDGSSDNTWDDIKKCKQINDKVLGINLNKNYGQSIGLAAGFKKVTGDIIFTLDGDRQNNPADFMKLYNKLIDDNLDVVAGFRAKRKDPIWMLVVTKAARFLRGILIKDGVKDSGCTLRIYKKEAIKSLELWGEMHRFIIALLNIEGYKIGEIKVDHRARTIGTSKYNWKKSIKGLIDLIYIWFLRKYEARPLHLFGFLGFLNAVLGGVMIIWAIFKRLFMDLDISNNGFFIMGIFLFQIGVLLFIFGIIIDLLIRNNYASKNQERFIIKEEI